MIRNTRPNGISQLVLFRRMKDLSMQDKKES